MSFGPSAHTNHLVFIFFSNYNLYYITYLMQTCICTIKLICLCLSTFLHFMYLLSVCEKVRTCLFPAGDDVENVRFIEQIETKDMTGLNRILCCS